MELLHVKTYHRGIADHMYNHTDKTKNPYSMFYFLKDNGEERQTGWVVQTETGCKWFPNKNKAEFYIGYKGG